MKISEKIRQAWARLTIRKKILAFTGTVILIIGLSVLFATWVLRFSLTDLNGILKDNSKCNTFARAMENEAELFEQYMKDPEKENEKQLNSAIIATRNAVNALPFDSGEIGDVRYAWTWSIHSMYEVYEQRRDEIMLATESLENYIEKLYEVYNIQSYLQEYANYLLNATIADSSIVYEEKIPAISAMPWIAVGVGLILFVIMAELAKVMNRTLILPIMDLVKASKRIAENDFFVEDVEVENQDELGELVHAFNKMKYATSEYIMALEERNIALDRLHEEEVRRLEVEKRLESMRLEALKNQIKPHFLFNSLNVIGGMAMLENAETTEKMIKSLSSLFRYNLQNQETQTTLTQELKIVRDYMYIQQMRFGERVDYRIDCQAEEKRVLIPAFTFQPLVENAIIHGLSPKEEGGKIYIRIWEKDKTLCITVCDTGVGMKAETLEKIKVSMEQEYYNYSSIGLNNIWQRIKLTYPGSDMQIRSRESVGTLVRLSIPQG